MTSTTVAILTLGCRLNQTDAAIMHHNLRNAGWTIVSADQIADAYIINSCTVTSTAYSKTRQAAQRCKRLNPDGVIAVVGCSATVENQQWLGEAHIDMVLPTEQKQEVVERLNDHFGKSTGSPPTDATLLAPDLFTVEGHGLYPYRTRANLKVQEGCDFFCSYCIVPYARGKPKSRAWDDTMRETRQLIDAGFRELVLTGVNLACYNDNGRRLPELLLALANLDSQVRIRLSSTEPMPDVKRVIDVMASTPNICRFLHLPLQYGADRILRQMNRRYTVAEFTEIAEYALAAIPNLCLGTDLIVGFPGETEEDFNACLQTVRDLPFGLIHQFKYSVRQGTPAADMDEQIPPPVMDQRSKQLSDLATEKVDQFVNSQLDKTTPVLIESVKNSVAIGWTDHYLRAMISCNNDNQLAPGQIVMAQPVAQKQKRQVTCRLTSS